MPLAIPERTYPPMNHNLKFLYAMELFSGLSRGSFLVCIGWTTLIETGEIASVGQVFVVGMLTVILAGPLLGTVVDRFNRKTLVLGAHFGIAVVMLGAGIAIDFTDLPPIAIFFTITFLIYTLRLLYQLAHDGLIRSNVSDSALIHTIARARTIHLLATAVGTIGVGVILESQGALAGFAASASGSLFLLIPVIFVRGAKSSGGSAGLSGYFRDLVGGFTILMKIPEVRNMAILAAFSLPLGQLVNAVLSSFVHDDLGLGGDVFGLVDSAWPLGGMAAAAIMSLGLVAMSGRYMVFVFSTLAGLATIAFSLASTVLALVAIHAAMGFLVWSCRILVDGQVLLACGEHRVGRAKVCVDMMTAFSAAAMSLSPTFISLDSASGYFLFWGSFATIGSLALGVWSMAYFRSAR